MGYGKEFLLFKLLIVPCLRGKICLAIIEERFGQIYESLRGKINIDKSHTFGCKKYNLMMNSITQILEFPYTLTAHPSHIWIFLLC